MNDVIDKRKENASIIDVAKYILTKNGAMRHRDLQALCYYCNAYAMAWDDTPILDEDFAAWNGCVMCEELRKCYDGIPIAILDKVSHGNIDNISKDGIQTIDVVTGIYKIGETSGLEWDITKTYPWKKTRLDAGLSTEISTSKDLRYPIISKELMKEYYSTMSYLSFVILDSDDELPNHTKRDNVVELYKSITKSLGDNDSVSIKAKELNAAREIIELYSEKIYELNKIVNNVSKYVEMDGYYI